LTRPDQIAFSFGQNWLDFLQGVSPEALAAARQDIEAWLADVPLHGRRVLDIGSGSGIHSLGFVGLGCEVVSFDLDPKSVSATRTLWEQAGKPAQWRVLEGSVLDTAFLAGLGWESFDVVYAWGVLHHTGALWEAVEHTLRMVKPGGVAWLAVYTRRPTYAAELALKLRYNRASPLGRKLMIWRRIASIMWDRLKHLRNPLAWNHRVERGMDVYHNLLDWFGGLPYEVASEEEMVVFTRKRGFILERIRTGQANTDYLLWRPPGAQLDRVA
jgi:2-polyprenyl-6-hydroxyphenyl methylase/3-demethylubiquinone-9 3-methyltransferase